MARPSLPAVTALLVLGVAGAAFAQRPANQDRASDLLDALARRMKICAEVTDSGQRLACYDRIDSDVGSAAAPAPVPPPMGAPRPLAPPPGAGPVASQPLPPPPMAPQPGDPRPLAPPPAAYEPPPPQTFRDPVTGRVYDPGSVGQPGDKPVPPEDRAFDPRAQGRDTIGPAPGTGPAAPRYVEATSRFIGSVPRVSGPGSNVPLVTLELPGLRINPNGRWALEMQLANNSAQTFDVIIACSFNNGDRRMDEVLVTLRSVRGGEKVATDLVGPPAQVYVDNAPCAVRTPR